MMPIENSPPHSLGLWGDGDEIAAIRDVERQFDVQLDYSDARKWVTVGDVFAALQRALPAQADITETWAKFAEVISAETGVNSIEVTPETALLGTRHLSWRLQAAVALVASLMALLIYR